MTKKKSDKQNSPLFRLFNCLSKSAADILNARLGRLTRFSRDKLLTGYELIARLDKLGNKLFNSDCCLVVNLVHKDNIAVADQ